MHVLYPFLLFYFSSQKWFFRNTKKVKFSLGTHVGMESNQQDALLRKLLEFIGRGRMEKAEKLLCKETNTIV